MAKTKAKTQYVCQNCGSLSAKWLGKCPDCLEWNTFQEEAVLPKQTRVEGISSQSAPKPITQILSGDKERFDTGISELNRVLGGGLVKGSLTLISGDPGIGKSTLLLQCAHEIAKRYGTVLYVSGEESEEQIKIRGDRLSATAEKLFIVSETSMEVIEGHIRDLKPAFVIIDSIQTVYTEKVTSAPGSVSQVRECANSLMRIGKLMGIPLFIVAHVTKQGELAGPRVLEHMVDSVLYFEGERTEEIRVLRTMKNRFGTTSEIGVFEMAAEGLVEVYDPSRIFLEDHRGAKEGSMVIGIMEGTRPLLVQVQSLVAETKAVMPRRSALGIEIPRLNMILAVLEKKLKIPFYASDVYVNVVGGLSVEGTSQDLGLALSLVSSAKGRDIKYDRLMAIGEIGLTGEIRPVNHVERLIGEGVKMGFEYFMIPSRNMEKIKMKNIHLIPVDTLKEAVNKIF
ncbi:DNA repair protein RadA [Proteiniclasticum ruminis]|jgi:DNA repair protein RadA/Sms|uniref:DNA repair protein RadA n=1 Tax=Proteiniclasticum ruminis TaxID=398199 RepID=A0A1G8SWW5_9CLOT|nr:DNA repair protein RadA [Proteiniclasticum ruminis]MBP9920547.1 DNA repair protein RadA [Proteiniclasticum sp.]SDJ33691.1 DNA repair protein RadA/Sms [Proteiniclasticum ruminis]